MSNPTSQDRRAEARLITLGRMAEGVAHDFNNLLTVMLGYSEDLIDEFPDDHEARRSSEQIREAAQRAIVLTRQLLAYRRAEGGEPELVDVSRTAENLERLLRRILVPHFEFEIEALPRGPEVRIAPERLEQAIVHLVLGARDALPGAGRIVLRVASHPSDAGRRRFTARLRAPARSGLLDTPSFATGRRRRVDLAGHCRRSRRRPARRDRRRSRERAAPFLGPEARPAGDVSVRATVARSCGFASTHCPAWRCSPSSSSS